MLLRTPRASTLVQLDKQTAAKAAQVFLDPRPVYGWDDIVTGRGAPFPAVAGNTFRGFHRVDQERPGATSVFMGYFVENRPVLLESLRSVRDESDLNEVADRLVADLLARLEGVVKPAQLRSYNKVRKPVDLYVEHLVAMAREIDRQTRERLVPLLFLPLDGQVFASEVCFRDSELRRYGVSRRSTSGSLSDAGAYAALQSILSERAGAVASQLGAPFHRIYFDLLWNDRWKRSGQNLFALNPA